MKKAIIYILLIITTISLQFCAPVFSELQGARLVGKGQGEIMTSYSSVNISDGERTEGLLNQVGLQSTFGLSSNTDLRIRFEYLWAKANRSYNDQIFGIGTKFGLIRDRISLYTPIGFAFSDVGNSFEFQPTILFTIPLAKNQFDLNPSLKYIIPFCDYCENLIAMNLGISIGKDVKRNSFRAEYGLLYNPGETGHLGQFSLGISHVFKMKERTQ